MRIRSSETETVRYQPLPTGLLANEMSKKYWKSGLSREARQCLEESGVALYVSDRPFMGVYSFTAFKTSSHPNGIIVVGHWLPVEYVNNAVLNGVRSLQTIEALESALGFLDNFSEIFVSSVDDRVSINLAGVILPQKKSDVGTLVVAHTSVWSSLVQKVNQNWHLAFDLTPYKWEEIIAGAFDIAGFDEVTLTPKSGDRGRDIIAIKYGVGSIKIISSVKAYKPDLRVGYDDIRALLGVMSGERDTSKGIIVTTSDFPPNVFDDPFIAPFIPTRLELLNGAGLRDWLTDLTAPPHGVPEYPISSVK